MLGLVMKTHNRFYQVRVKDQDYLCSPKGTFKKAEEAYRLPVIGDQVQILLDSGANEGVDGYITAIEPRKNTLARDMGDGRRQRLMASNLDLVLLVSALIKPGIDTGLIDRYLCACELAEIPVALIANKTDLQEDWEADAHWALYRSLGYQVLGTSVKQNKGLDELFETIGSGITLLTGNSGVGKSSIANLLAPGTDLSIGEVSEKGGTGKHTTTFSVLIPLTKGGYLADSPGLRDFAPPPMEPEQIRFGFRDIAQLQTECRFSSCLHDQEPGCAVRAAHAEGKLAPFRYSHYRSLFREMRQTFQDRYQ